jgi:RNA polymerase sporulation-specific sigma factor
MSWDLFVLLALNFTYLALYIANPGSFPRPLTASEEQKYLAQWKNGNIEARNILIERNLRLVAHIIKKYYSNSRDQDDLISVGTIGLIKAVNTFDCDKGVRLATYASRCIENEILMFFRASKNIANEVSISDPIDSDKDGNALTLMDIISCEDTVIEKVDLHINAKRLRKLVNMLGERERSVIEMRYGLGGQLPKPQRKVSETLGISRSYVSRIEKKALLKLKRLFTSEQ